MEVLSNFFPAYNPSTGLVRKIFGCVSFVHVHSNARGKLDLRAIKCVFIGYSSTQKGYKCYHSPTRKIFVTADVTFVENESYFRPSLQGEMTLEEKDNLFLLNFPLENAPPSLENVSSGNASESENVPAISPSLVPTDNS